MAKGLSARVIACVEADITDTGGVGGTLAGNALTLAGAYQRFGCSVVRCVRALCACSVCGPRS